MSQKCAKMQGQNVAKVYVSFNEERRLTSQKGAQRWNQNLPTNWPRSTSVDQASIFFSWAQWQRDHALRDESVVYVNIDETSIAKGLAPRKGYLLFNVTTKRSSVKALVRSRDTRAHSTFLAAITDEAALQQHLPQFLIPHQKRLSRAEKTLLATLAGPLVWVQDATGWMKSQTLKGLITIIRRKVRLHCPGKSLILVLDTAPCHRERSVLNHCSHLGIHVLFIPAKLTWLLQPLDTHVFAMFKQRYFETLLQQRQRSTDGTNSGTDWIEALRVASTEILTGRNWVHAFGCNGVPPCRQSLRGSIVQICHTGGPWSCTPPSADDLKLIMGVNLLNVRDALLRLPLRILHQPRPMRLVPIARLPRRARLPPAPLPPPAFPPPALDSEGAGPFGAAGGDVAPESVRRTRSGALY